MAGAPIVSFRGMVVRGRVEVAGGTCDAESTTFENSVATLDGGAIAMTSGTLLVRQSTFANNRAGQNGGAVYVANGTASFDQCTFKANTAQNGGGVHASGGSVALGQQTLFEGNTASGSGNSIYTDGGSVAYTLPTPLGRWIYSASSAYETVIGSVDSDYPFACTLHQPPGHAEILWMISMPFVVFFSHPNCCSSHCFRFRRALWQRSRRSAPKRAAMHWPVPRREILLGRHERADGVPERLVLPRWRHSGAHVRGGHTPGCHGAVSMQGMPVGVRL